MAKLSIKLNARPGGDYYERLQGLDRKRKARFATKDEGSNSGKETGRIAYYRSLQLFQLIDGTAFRNVFSIKSVTASILFKLITGTSKLSGSSLATATRVVS
jgi:hypothetical protein